MKGKEYLKSTLVSDQTGGKHGVDSKQSSLEFQEDRGAHRWAVTWAMTGALWSTPAVAPTHVY